MTINLHNLGIDPAVAFQQSKHNRFAISTTTPFTSNTARIKVRFINFNGALQRRLLLARDSNTSPQFEVNAVHRTHRNTGQLRNVGRGKVHRKIADHAGCVTSGLYLESGRGYKKISEEFGWVENHKKEGGQAFPGEEPIKPADSEMAL